MACLSKGIQIWISPNQLTPKLMIEQLKKSSAQLKLYQAEKQFSKQREMELFEMMENGCLISKGELFYTLQQLRGEQGD